MTEKTIDVETDFVDHVHIYTSPTGRVFVQHERNEGFGEPDPKKAIAILVQAARAVAAAHNISLEGDA